ncbi:MAG: NmrA family NAD(P)-binding protein [Spirochaetaceae bacterium]
MNILVTGATGNTGLALIAHLSRFGDNVNIIAGVRDSEKAKAQYSSLQEIECREFDFEKIDTFESAFSGIDLVFLLRPPHISKIKRYFEPLISKMTSMGIQKVVLLSVQGAEKTKIIPHRKIELLIIEYGLDYICIRPSYFMQNLTTTLYPEIKRDRTITLPSGEAEFNWIDVDDIARLGAQLILSFEKYKNRAFTVTGNQNLSFPQVASIIRKVAGVDITYKSVHPLKYFIKKKREGVKIPMIIVMLVLHFLPRIQGKPEIVKTYKELLHCEPRTVEEFVELHKREFQ